MHLRLTKAAKEDFACFELSCAAAVTARVLVVIGKDVQVSEAKLLVVIQFKL